MECKFFKEGRCFKGDACKFKHSSPTQNSPNSPVNEDQKKRKNCLQLQSIELSNLEKDYKIIDKTGPVKIQAKITDPEFPFDMESIECIFEVPEDYPLSSPCKFKCLDQQIPSQFISTIETGANRVAAEMKGKMAIDTVLKWLLRNLEPVLSGTSTPKSTLKFVSYPKNIQEPAFMPANQNNNGNIPVAKTGNIATVQKKEETQEIDVKKLERKIAEMNVAATQFPIWDKPPSFGYLIKLVKLEIENIALITCSSFSISMKCVRCHKAVEFENVRHDVDRIEKCTKCDRECRTAVPTDFLPSTLQIMCFNCPSDHKYEPIFFVPGVKSGENVKYGCHWCHSKLSFSFSGVEFSEISSPFQKEATKKSSEKQKLLIKPGEPLPENGTCVHYKKSFRWLRFPCCGKAYPCDECHNLENKDHKAEWANRMICGYCSKEQPYSQKLCSCGSSLSTATMKRSAFWEGGKGTRNTLMMSKKDSHKYSGLTKPKK